MTITEHGGSDHPTRDGIRLTVPLDGRGRSDSVVPAINGTGLFRRRSVTGLVLGPVS